MKKLLLILLFAASAQADTITSASGALTLVGKKPDGTTTGQAVIDGNGFMSIKGITGTGVDPLNISGNGRDINLIASSGRVVTLGNANVTVDSSGWITSWKGASFGGKVNAASGTVSASSSEVVNGSQLYTTNASVSNLTSTVNTNQAALNALSTTVSNNFSDLSNQATVKANASLISGKAYTDSKILATEAVVTNEVARVDSRIDATNSAVASNATKALNDATAKANAALASANSYTDSQVATVNSNSTTQVNEVRKEVKAERDRAVAAEGLLQREINAVGAMTMAISAANSSVAYSEDKKTSVTVGYGFYGSEQAISAGVGHFINAQSRISANIAKSAAGKTGVGVGASYSF
jgi:hypothetical protein